jgi:hypothetical protein
MVDRAAPVFFFEAIPAVSKAWGYQNQGALADTKNLKLNQLRRRNPCRFSGVPSDGPVGLLEWVRL